jgi:hypothetical protein
VGRRGPLARAVRPGRGIGASPAARVRDDLLLFNTSIEVVGAEGFRRLRLAHPGAIVQCSVDLLAPLVLAAPRRARAVLRMMAGWGISRFSVAWAHETTLSLVQALQDWGYEINLYAVPDRESFLHAVLLLPRVSHRRLQLPDWNHFGRGSGERRGFHPLPDPSRLRLPEERYATARDSLALSGPAGRAWDARLR